MIGVFEGLVVFSEVVLSAYPLLIKLVDASVFFQVGLRMAVYTAMAALAGLVTGAPILPATLFSKETAAIGALNLAHVAGSYLGFEQLAGGNAMALFYTYPVFNILGAAWLLGETIPSGSWPWIGVAVAGAMALSSPTTTNWTLVGVVGALLAALTETGIYLWFKGKGGGEGGAAAAEDATPWAKMVQMYGSSGLLWALGAAVAAAVGVLGRGVFRVGGNGLRNILLFNALVGFGGYALRFFLIPRVSTVVFSALSFFGVIAAYLLSWVFAGEVPTALQLAGAAAIIVANSVLVTRETV
jgi:drug/metabolite transporter (DMT)-like permease